MTKPCKAYLAKYKWSDGFVCLKCGGTKGCIKKAINIIVIDVIM